MLIPTGVLLQQGASKPSNEGQDNDAHLIGGLISNRSRSWDTGAIMAAADMLIACSSRFETRSRGRSEQVNEEAASSHAEK